MFKYYKQMVVLGVQGNYSIIIFILLCHFLFCSINAVTLALINAGIPMKDFICSCAAGYIEGTPILGKNYHVITGSSMYSGKLIFTDLNYMEDSAGGPDLPLAVLPQSGKITMLQMDSKLPIDMFEKVMRLAVDGCNAIYQIMVKEVEQYTRGLLEARGS